MNKVVIVSGARLPLGKFGGKLKDIKAPHLGSLAIKGAVEKINLDPNDIELVIMGNVLQAGLGQNPARQAALLSGIGKETPAFTVNEVCGSGLKTVHLAMQAIKLGEQDIVAVGGFENMSQAPYIINKARFGASYNNLEVKDLLHHDGLIDVYSQKPMGITAENLAKMHNISREDQDAYAFESTQRAIKALESGVFDEEIVPVEVKDGIMSQDEGVRFDTSLEKLSKLKPAFLENGTVSAGNSSTLNDGAAALILMSEKEAIRRNLEILAYVDDYQEIGMEPSLMGYAPFYAINKLVKKNDLDLNTVDLFEINEAFAAQMIAVIKDLNLDANKVNVNGGGISLGHPIGTSGARIVVSLIHQMQRDNSKSGIASICMGGGMGSALLVSRK